MNTNGFKWQSLKRFFGLPYNIPKYYVEQEAKKFVVDLVTPPFTSAWRTCDLAPVIRLFGVNASFDDCRVDELQVKILGRIKS